VAGRTRKDIEKQTGKPVISKENFKQLAVKKTKKLKGSGERPTRQPDQGAVLRSQRLGGYGPSGSICPGPC
jgi:hypothetical protein